MREYKMIEGYESPYKFRLDPIDGDKNHQLGFTSEDSAHKFKLALMLGTFPDPACAPEKWQTIDFMSAVPLMIPTEYLPDEEPPPGCCQSGCDGCPDFRG